MHGGWLPDAAGGASREQTVEELCAAGMQAEADGNVETASRLFERAWAVRQDAYEACVAAHFLARAQTSETQRLCWNERALQCADASPAERVRGFYASLYLNLGHAHEMLGATDEARRLYALAAARLEDVPAGPYGDVVREGILRAHQRVRPDLSDL
jgi:hypothetical protein